MLFRITKPYAYWQAERGDYYIGSHYFENISDDADAVLSLRTFSTQTYDLNFQTHVASDGKSRMRVYEDCTMSNNGTEVPLYNSCRYSTSEINCTLYHTPTISDLGTKIYDFLSPGGKYPKLSGITNGEIPASIVHLKKNSKYAIVVTNLSGKSEDISIAASIGKVI